MSTIANRDSVQAAESGPDYQGVIDLVRGDLDSLKRRQSSLGQAASTAWNRIAEQMRCNPKGAKMFAAIDGMDANARVDALRTFLNLIAIAGYGNMDDLVDRAEKPTTRRRAPDMDPPKAKTDAAPPAPPSDSSDLADAGDVGAADGFEMSEEELNRQRDRPRAPDGVPADKDWKPDMEKQRQMAEEARLARATPMSDEELAGTNPSGRPKRAGKPKLGIVK